MKALREQKDSDPLTLTTRVEQNLASLRSIKQQKIELNDLISSAILPQLGRAVKAIQI